MNLKGKTFTVVQMVALICYYGFTRWLPNNDTLIIGKFCGKLRAFNCRFIFKKMAKDAHVWRKAYFALGTNIEIGSESSLGINCVVPDDIKIGDNVMMGPNCYIFHANHETSDVSKPMNQQGRGVHRQTIIEDDVWIGRNVTMTPGRIIKKGSIIGACCLLCRNFPEYSVVGGVPSVLIKSRLSERK